MLIVCSTCYRTSWKSVTLIIYHRSVSTWSILIQHETVLLTRTTEFISTHHTVKLPNYTVPNTRHRALCTISLLAILHATSKAYFYSCHYLQRSVSNSNDTFFFQNVSPQPKITRRQVNNHRIPQLITLVPVTRPATHHFQQHYRYQHHHQHALTQLTKNLPRGNLALRRIQSAMSMTTTSVWSCSTTLQRMQTIAAQSLAKKRYSTNFSDKNSRWSQVSTHKIALTPYNDDYSKTVSVSWSSCTRWRQVSVGFMFQTVWLTRVR